jgi:hypothetical protein
VHCPRQIMKTRSRSSDLRPPDTSRWTWTTADGSAGQQLRWRLVPPIQCRAISARLASASRMPAAGRKR